MISGDLKVQYATSLNATCLFSDWGKLENYMNISLSPDEADFNKSLEENLSQPAEKEIVVFHCMVGQERTPRAASKYMQLMGRKVNGASQKQFVCMIHTGIMGVGTLARTYGVNL